MTELVRPRGSEARFHLRVGTQQTDALLQQPSRCSLSPALLCRGLPACRWRPPLRPLRLDFPLPKVPGELSPGEGITLRILQAPRHPPPTTISQDCMEAARHLWQRAVLNLPSQWKPGPRCFIATPALWHCPLEGPGSMFLFLPFPGGAEELPADLFKMLA